MSSGVPIRTVCGAVSASPGCFCSHVVSPRGVVEIVRNGPPVGVEASGSSTNSIEEPFGEATEKEWGVSCPRVQPFGTRTETRGLKLREASVVGSAGLTTTGILAGRWTAEVLVACAQGPSFEALKLAQLSGLS